MCNIVDAQKRAIVILVKAFNWSMWKDSSANERGREGEACRSQDFLRREGQCRKGVRGQKRGGR